MLFLLLLLTLTDFFLYLKALNELMILLNYSTGYHRVVKVAYAILLTNARLQYTPLTQYCNGDIAF